MGFTAIEKVLGRVSRDERSYGLIFGTPRALLEVLLWSLAAAFFHRIPCCSHALCSREHSECLSCLDGQASHTEVLRSAEIFG